VPSSVIDRVNLGDVAGITALVQAYQQRSAPDHGSEQRRGPRVSAAVAPDLGAVRPR
jgi:hypothetical protein